LCHLSWQEDAGTWNEELQKEYNYLKGKIEKSLESLQEVEKIFIKYCGENGENEGLFECINRKLGEKSG